MKTIKLNIKTKMQAYSIIIGSNLILNISKILKDNSIDFKKCLLIIDKNISNKIVSKIKKSINEIFRTKGESFFREFEEKITLKKLELETTIISLGGGAFINKNIRSEVLKNHISFWLDWHDEELLGRIKKSKKRPLAFNTADNELIDLIKKRSNIYSKASYEIKCDKLSKQEIVKKILEIYENY